MNQKEWKNNLISVLRNIDISCPKTLSLYMMAFTHKTYANENKLNYNQQRLEFLGDSAIGWIISNYLFGINPKINEGDMTIIKSKLVCSKMLAKAAKDIKIDKLLLLGKGLLNQPMTDKMLEDTFEAFVGAIVQDQGIKKGVSLINKTLIKYHKDNLVKFDKDFKTQFQEIIQSTSSATNHQIRYEHIDAKDVKTSKVYYMDNLYGVGRAKNFKEADQLAAKDAISKCQFKK